jgi:hypothetical protein
MKMKHAKIIIRSVDSIKKDWKNALKGGRAAFCEMGKVSPPSSEILIV